MQGVRDVVSNVLPLLCAKVLAVHAGHLRMEPFHSTVVVQLVVELFELLVELFVEQFFIEFVKQLFELIEFFVELIVELKEFFQLLKFQRRARL